MTCEKTVKAHHLCAIVLLCAVFSALTVLSPVYAYDSDAALETDGYRCTRQIARSERQYGIPLRLLGAIATQESGRLHRGLGVLVPWPWTINAAGTPYLFHSKAEAIAKVRELQAAGVDSIDVGCMQVNLRHHPNAFANLNQAFEPAFNVGYAARYLRSHYDETGSWKTAVGYYHSRTPDFAQRYIASVYNKWYAIAGSVARARANEYAANNYAMVNGKPANLNIAPEPVPASYAASSRYNSYIRDESSGKQVALNAAPGLKIVRPATNSQTSRKTFNLALVRPAEAAGKTAVAPTVDMSESTNSMIMNLKPEGKAAKSKIVSANSHREQSDPRILKFVD